MESHAPPVAEARNRVAPTPPIPEGLSQPQLALFEQMVAFFREVMGAIPIIRPPQPPPQKSHLEKLIKYGAMDFLGKKEDDPAATEH